MVYDAQIYWGSGLCPSSGIFLILEDGQSPEPLVDMRPYFIIQGFCPFSLFLASASFPAFN
jgi:hypothetical protein